MTNTTVTPFSALISSAIDIAKNDSLHVALPVFDGFFTNIIQNPARVNIIAQLAALSVTLPAALPNFEQALTKDIASLLKTQVDALAASFESPSSQIAV